MTNAGFPFILGLDMNYRSILIATAQATLLYLSGFIIPLIGQVLMLFTPVPLIILALRHGRNEGAAALVGSCIIVALLGGWQIAGFLVAGFGLMALGISEGMRRRMNVEYIALLGGLLPLVVMGAALAFYFIHLGKSPITMAEEYMRESVAEAASLYTKLGFIEMAAAVSSLSEKFVHYFVRLLPGMIIATSVAQAAACYGVARAAFMRNPGPGVLPPSQTSLALWHAPDSWVWGLIAALALLVFPDETTRLVGWNIAILFGTVYLAQGTALVDYFLRKMRTSPVIRTVVIAVMLAMPPIIACMVALGVADIWADFRKVRIPMQKE